MSEQQPTREEIDLQKYPELDPYYKLVSQFIEDLESDGVDITDLCCVEAKFQGPDPYILREIK